MFYFSEIKNKKVYTEEGTLLGKLSDLVFSNAETPLITKLVVRTDKKILLFIPIQYLKKLVRQKTIQKAVVMTDYQTTELTPAEFCLEKNILNRQVIDLNGNKVVRINDIVLNNNPNYYVTGVAIDIWGILRWFGLEKVVQKILAIFEIKSVPHFLSWADIQPLELGNEKVMLKKTKEKLDRILPEDLADYLEQTNLLNAMSFLRSLEENYAAEVISSLNINYQTELLSKLNPPEAAKIISLIDPDEAVDVLLALSHKKRRRILTCLGKEKKAEIETLLDLSHTPIGNLITSEFLTVKAEDTVDKVLKIIKLKTADFDYLDNIYVTNYKNQLIGVCNLHDLLLQEKDTPLLKCMNQNVIIIHLTTTEELAVKKMLKYKVHSLPVIDKEKHMLGVVTFDDAAESVLKKLGG